MLANVITGRYSGDLDVVGVSQHWNKLEAFKTAHRSQGYWVRICKDGMKGSIFSKTPLGNSDIASVQLWIENLLKDKELECSLISPSLFTPTSPHHAAFILLLRSKGFC